MTLSTTTLYLKVAAKLTQKDVLGGDDAVELRIRQDVRAAMS